MASTNLPLLPSSPKTVKQNKALPGLDIEWEGAICDSEGFYQHTGECISDAFQMLILNADGIKEIVQEQLINDPIQLKKVRERVKGAASPTDHKHLVEYLHALRSRFVRHYSAEKKRRITFKSRTCDDQAKMKELMQAIGKEPVHRSDAANVYKTAMYQRAIVNYNRPLNNPKNALEELRKSAKMGVSKQTAITMPQLKRMYELISLYFGLDEVVDFKFVKETTHLFNPDLSTTAVQSAVINPTTHTGHAILFYTCAGHEYFYEDNSGIIPFSWRRYMDISSYPPLQQDWTRFYSVVGIDITLDNDDEDVIFSYAYYPCLVETKDTKVKIHFFEPNTGKLMTLTKDSATDRNLFFRHIEKAPPRRGFSVFSRRTEFDKKYRIKITPLVLNSSIYANLRNPSTDIPYNGEPVIPGSRLPRTRAIQGGRTRKNRR